ncbi:Cytochrome c oxidase subunit 3 [Datura stramonium]|uniref:Cytochrome c oxidase subunit 3 n=1 Tax=Datura stramonium TaxID=4076 RepID=A0ABS8SXY2_DATST|nr:Cytochrome c oxidase subunit 3 [Datura stramonium]
MIESQRHSYHLVDLIPWPILGSLGALATTVGGTIFSIICGIFQYLGHLTKEHHIGFEAAAWYWHFVDVVQLFLFVSIYWSGVTIASAGAVTIALAGDKHSCSEVLVRKRGCFLYERCPIKKDVPPCPMQKKLGQLRRVILGDRKVFTGPPGETSYTPSSSD